MSERDLGRVNGASFPCRLPSPARVASSDAVLPDGAREPSACWRVGIRDIRHGAVSRAFRPLTPGPACRRRARRHDRAVGRARRRAEREFLRDAVRPPAAAAPVRAAAGEPLRRSEPVLFRRASGTLLGRRRPRRRLLRAAVRRALFPDPAPCQCEPGAALQRVLPGGQDAGVQRQPDRPRLCGRWTALRRSGERVRLPPADRRGLQLQRQGRVRSRARRRGVRSDAAAGRHRVERRQRQGGADRDACRQGTWPVPRPSARRCAARARRPPSRLRAPRLRPKHRCRPRRPTTFRKTDL